MNKNAEPSRNLRFIDGMRGLAALYVMVGHARWLLWEGYSEGYLRHPQAYGGVDRGAMYFFSMFRFGHEAVMFFFVLSGFLIHLRLASRYSKGDLSDENWGLYVLRRTKRIYPPLIACLLITSVCDYYGTQINTAPYMTVAVSLNQSSLAYGPVVLFGNLLFLGAIRTPVWGSDGPLWSLSYEGWFYVIYPLFALMSRRSAWAPMLVSVCLFGMSFLSFWGEPLSRAVAAMFVCWWFGAFLADVYCGRLPIKLNHLSTATAVLVPAIFASGVWRDVLFSLGFTGVLSHLLCLSEHNVLKTWIAKLRPLGDFSYSLYLTHLPVICLLAACLRSSVFPGGTPPRTSNYILLAVLITCVVAYFLHLAVEKPFLKPRSAS